MSVRILALVGSLRAGSTNRQLAEAAVKHDLRALGGVLDGRLGELAVGRTGAKASDERENANRHANSKGG